MIQKHSVGPKGHERAHISVVLVNVLAFHWFLWLHSHYHPTKIITLCSIGWLRILTGKIQRWRCILINVQNGSTLFFSLALSDKLFKSFSCHRFSRLPVLIIDNRLAKHWINCINPFFFGYRWLSRAWHVL